MTQTRKRFIAGAECPACHLEDTLMLTVTGEQEEVHCVQCGHQFSERGAKPAATTTNSEQPGLIGIFKPD
ncbi:hypothetical protein SAMN02927930_01301 [Pseudidiomarina indica]|uniref:Uncharacterized protein n=1 Tax=Pseudidiomarina indica TaxID=1159017 RepID=A0A1G6CLS3_9GAMM|nr:YheV family putative zinc ribbon protein [Pseudidiomarina indica]SDB33816.1 hypothetical protein SAMN02927930_01301 [Pseudidiomarina indica]